MPFPDDLHAFAAFAKKHRAALGALELVPTGPLRFLLGGALEEARYYDDPPEFVTILRGRIDGLHWGYWFDAPGELQPVVVSYYANDAFELREDGPTLFDAVRKHLEALASEAEESLAQDPGQKGERAALDAYAKLRRALPRPRKNTRKAVAATRNRLGIVTRPRQYAPLEKRDSFARWNYGPTARQVQKLVAAARLPGTALKLGHDLWVYPQFRAQSVALLDQAYSGLGREVLRAQLKKAIAWRATCDAQK